MAPVSTLLQELCYLLYKPHLRMAGPIEPVTVACALILSAHPQELATFVETVYKAVGAGQAKRFPPCLELDSSAELSATSSLCLNHNSSIPVVGKQAS
eukprot:1145508-Amphidinium_carterae.4